MGNYLEWSHAYAGRLNQNDCKKLAEQAPALAERLKKGLAAGEMPFLSMTYRKKLEELIPGILHWVNGYKDMLVLGIGGSALGARAMQKAFAPGQDGPNYDGPGLWIADNVCAEQFEGLLSKLDPLKTLVVCISKSGGTIETISQYFIVCEWLKKARGAEWNKQMIVITDESKGFLREEAKTKNYRSLIVPDFLGGRYSALSAVGLFPAAFMGMDWQEFLNGAAEIAKPLIDNPENIAKHPSFSLACWAKTLMDHNYSDLIFFCYIPQWAYYGAWFAQLWAESLGKDGKGSMPIPAVGVTDQHSVNQMFLDGMPNKGCLFVTGEQKVQGPAFDMELPERWAWLKGKHFGALLEAEALGTRMALCKRQIPLVNMHMGSLTEHSAGAMMLLLEAATIFTGWLMDINPVDQPAVELGKRLANSKLGAPGYAAEDADLKAFLAAPQDRQSF